MSYRLVRAVMGQGQCHAKVQYSAELEEYRVRFYRHAERLEDADYFTNDRADAIGTAQHEIARMEGEQQ